MFGFIGFVLSREIQQTQTYHFQNFQHIGGIQQAIDDKQYEANNIFKLQTTFGRLCLASASSSEKSKHVTGGSLLWVHDASLPFSL